MTGEFIKLRCGDCGNEQIIFNKASRKIRCNVCGATIAESSGGKARISSKIVEVLK